MTDCADSTALRTHLDHPDPALDAHLDSCDTCAGLARSVAADAGSTRVALALLDGEAEHAEAGVDVEAALADTLARTAPPRGPVVPLGAARRYRVAAMARRVALSGAAAAVVLGATLTPAGRDAVADVLDALRGERLQVVTVDSSAWAASLEPEDLVDLEALGEVDTSDLAEPTEVDDVAEAEAVSGISAPTLPEEPDHLLALAPGTARLVLEARDGNGVPAGLDGAALVVDVPGAIGAVSGDGDGPPELVIGRSGTLVVRSEGAPLEDIRSFVLSREELPADLRAQLADIDDWRSTIPIPVPLDGPGWEEVEVGGRPAIAFGDESGLGAVVLRQDAEGVTVVGGRMGISRALDLAGEA